MAEQRPPWYARPSAPLRPDELDGYDAAMAPKRAQPPGQRHWPFSPHGSRAFPYGPLKEERRP